MSSVSTPLDEARAAVLAEVRPLGSEAVALDLALGRVLAADARSPEPVPAFDNSAMDGYALRAADTRGASLAGPVSLSVAGEARAGSLSQAEVGAGQAFRISTGAPLPAGADAVVRQEVVERDGDLLRVVDEVPSGSDVRGAGEDIAEGAAVLARGTILGPAELGVLASVGESAPRCAERPRVRVVTTGDELVPPGAPRAQGGVRDSNSVTVAALARRAGAVVEVDGQVPDTAAATRDALRDGLAADVLITCGGVSVGPHDHVKEALAGLGVEERFWRVALRPGGPTWFGVAAGDRPKLVFGLPGNPVSAMVTFGLFVHPALLALQGASARRRSTTAILEGDVQRASGRVHAARCRAEPREDGWHVVPTGHQGSHVLTSMLEANALALLDAGDGLARAGERVAIELID